MARELIACPECRFQNPVRAKRCMMCKALLQGSTSARQAPPTEPALPRRRAGAGAPQRPEPVRRAPPTPVAVPGAGGVWLYCPPLDPIALPDGGQILIGRKNSDLDLPHKQVSRKHLMIRRRGGEVEVEDLGSSNGTFLNDQRLEGKSPFVAGDRIQIGPFELTLSSGSSEYEEGIDPSSTSAAAAWTGSLESVPLSEVLHDLEFNQKTGTLEVRSGRIGARLLVFSGRPVSVTYDRKLKGHEAALAMLQLKGGRFIFQPSSKVKGGALPFTLTSLLLDHAREVDEG